MVFSTDFEPPMATLHAGSEKPLGLFCFGCFRLGNTVDVFRLRQYSGEFLQAFQLLKNTKY